MSLFTKLFPQFVADNIHRSNLANIRAMKLIGCASYGVKPDFNNFVWHDIVKVGGCVEFRLNDSKNEFSLVPVGGDWKCPFIVVSIFVDRKANNVEFKKRCRLQKISYVTLDTPLPDGLSSYKKTQDEPMKYVPPKDGLFGNSDWDTSYGDFRWLGCSRLLIDDGVFDVDFFR